MKNEMTTTKIHTKTIEVLKILRSKGQGLPDVIDQILIGSGHMTKTGEPTKTIREAIRMREKAVAEFKKSGLTSRNKRERRQRKKSQQPHRRK